jgi:hypothetical protein
MFNMNKEQRPRVTQLVERETVMVHTDSIDISRSSVRFRSRRNFVLLNCVHVIEIDFWSI